MRLFIPEIGSKIILIKNWQFILYSEHRNQKLIEKLGKTFDWRKNESFLVTIPAGTILGVDRIYIRKGVTAYSSVTFTIPKSEKGNKNNSLAGVRFWASLSDVNQIEFDTVSCNQETMDILKNIHDAIKKDLSDPQAHENIMFILLDGSTINKIRPQENAFTFLRKALERLKGHNFTKQSYIVEKKRALEIVESEYRKFKIKNFLIEESENV